jgi:hypothetical protein
MPRRFSRTLLFAVLAPLAACGGDKPQPVTPAPSGDTGSPPPSSSANVATPPASGGSQEEAHKLVVLAASCWFGGMWADALGEQDQMKQAGVDGRCKQLEEKVWGADDKSHYEQLRALEQNALADVVAKVDDTAKGDAIDSARRDKVVKLVQALGDAQRELLTARRAGDRVKRDLDREPDKLTSDEVGAVLPLRAHDKWQKLLELDAGDLSKESHALALMCALDRLEIARGLPKHLKFYAVADEFNVLFGVPVPDVPEDATKKLVPGTWLAFLADTAKAAGHPVPDKAKTPRDRDAMAWAGMLQGFSDKLKPDADGIAQTTDLSKVATVVEHRLEAQFSAQQSAEATEGKKKGK